MAGFCAFVCPGLGHMVIGKPFQAVLMFVMIMACYKAHIILGLVLHAASIVDAVKQSRKDNANAIAEAIRAAQQK